MAIQTSPLFVKDKTVYLFYYTPNGKISTNNRMGNKKEICSFRCGEVENPWGKPMQSIK